MLKSKNRISVKKDNVVFRYIKGENLLIPTAKFGNSSLILFALNETGRFIWDNIDGCCREKIIVKSLIEKYDVKRDVARRDADNFLSLLEKKNLIYFRKA